MALVGLQFLKTKVPTRDRKLPELKDHLELPGVTDRRFESTIISHVRYCNSSSNPDDTEMEI